MVFRLYSDTASKLFKDMVFVLTQGSHPDLNTSVTSNLESETEPETHEPSTSTNGFDRPHVKRLILENGGTVLDEFPGPKAPVVPGLIIVSDRHCLTMTYLLGVSYKFRCISYLWILQSVDQQKLLQIESYFLPVGFSQVDKRMIEQSERSANLTRAKKGLFNNLHFLLTSTRLEFGNDWKPLLTRLGASVSFRSQGKLDRNLKLVNVIIADCPENAPASVVDNAMEKAIPIVTTGWVIESLISGNRVPFEQFIFHKN